MLQVPIYVINLVDRPERLKYIDYNFKKYNLKYNVVSVEKPLDKGKFKYIGERGCFYSHIKILEQALNKSDDIFIIAEDDAHLTDKFSYLFDTIWKV
jgi:GR25 family glycosyltransferase involved in LPS biosynthesis